MERKVLWILPGWWAGLTWEFCSNIPISPRLQTPFSPMYHADSGLPMSFSVGDLQIRVLANELSKVLEQFLAPQAKTLNWGFLLTMLISANSSWSNFMFLLLWSYALKFLSHTYSPDFFHCKLEKSWSSFGLYCTTSQVRPVTLLPYSFRACRDGSLTTDPEDLEDPEESCRARPEKDQSALQANNQLRGSFCRFFRQGHSNWQNLGV